MKRQLVHTYDDIISIPNLLKAWNEFIFDKDEKKPDIAAFSFLLMDHIIALHEDLRNRTYRHSEYHSFFITDPKRRHIHKASVRDRLLHHAVYRILYPFFDRTFIADSYSCRIDKGVHKAINRFRQYARIVSRNHTRTCWVLKCDIKQFFASVDHAILLNILTQYILDKNILNLLHHIIESFHTDEQSGRGMPLGNLTSQLLTNIYLNTFDQWVKHTLKVKYYIRYADDMVFLSEHRTWLESIIPHLQRFLDDTLHLTLHPNKLFLNTIASGMDFLGWVQFSDHRVLRNTTKRRMFRRLREHPTEESLLSYLGLLSHGNTSRVREDVVSLYWVLQ